MTPEDKAREEAEQAAAEAGTIGGQTSSSPEDDERDGDEAQRPLIEAGQGESEGFEEAERELVDHASHGDQHAARRVIGDGSSLDDDPRAADAGEADHERSSEREQDA